MKTFSLFLSLCLALPHLYAQYPQTDIYLMDIAIKGTQCSVKNPLKVSDNPGYDNQPYFTPDGKMLLFVSVLGQEAQTDICGYDLKTKHLRFIGKTLESEFSPKYTPDGKTISAVCIETDKDSTQRLWQYFVLDSGFSLHHSKYKVMLEEVKGIGYYDWVAKAELAVFIVGKTTHDLYHVQMQHPENKKKIAENVGRAIFKTPGKYAVSFVSKQDSNQWRIQNYDFVTHTTTTLAPTLPKCEDFCWHPKGFLVAGSQGNLYVFYPGKSKEWEKIADLKPLGINDFYRLTLNKKGNKLAIVTFSGKKP